MNQSEAAGTLPAVAGIVDLGMRVESGFFAGETKLQRKRIDLSCDEALPSALAKPIFPLIVCINADLH